MMYADLQVTCKSFASIVRVFGPDSIKAFAAGGIKTRLRNISAPNAKVYARKGWNGLSVFQQLRWTTEGDPWISTEFCQLLPTPRAVPRGGGANWEVCENNARSKILIWRKKKRYYMLILVTVQTQDPAIQSNQLMMSQSLPHVASVD